MPDYPPDLTIDPLTSPPIAKVRVPGSKSLTNRALIVAALADGPSTLTGALDSDDTRVMIDSLQKLAVKVEHDPITATIRIGGGFGRKRQTEADLFIANSGTSLRFLTAMVATSRGGIVYRLDGNARMRQRPVADLIQALNGLGSSAKSDLGTGCPPITVTADGLDGGFAVVKGDTSSQFLSGLLMALPYARELTTVEVEGVLVSQPYVQMTLEVMEAFGVRIGNGKFRRFNVQPAQYAGRKYAIEPDASAASYFFAAAAITGGTITVEGLHSKSIQGDLKFVDILEHMGCQVERGKDSTTVTGPTSLRGVDVDMNAISDTVMTLGVTAVFAQGLTRIRNVGHIRHKETDRIVALAAELRKLGATVDEQSDGLIIFPPKHVASARISTYDDHRMAMSFALAGLKADGVTIVDPGCVSKTYPGFWDDLAKLRGSEG